MTHTQRIRSIPENTRPPTTAVLGLGPLGAAVLARLRAEGMPTRGWSHRARPELASSPTLTQAVDGADIVILALHDGPACLAVTDTVAAHLAPRTVVVNLSTVSPDEARQLSERARDAGVRYWHAPVIGSVDAVRRGGLTVLLGGSQPDEPGHLQVVLDAVGTVLPCPDVAAAARAKLIANGVLAGALVELARAADRATHAALPSELTVELLSRTCVGGLVQAKRQLIDCPDTPADFSIGTLRKDVELLAALDPAAAPVAQLGHARRASSDIGSVFTRLVSGPRILDATARLFAAPGIDDDPGLLAPLICYARGHATGDATNFLAAFRPSAHVEGIREGRFVSWPLTEYCAVFSGRPAPDEAIRRRTVTSVVRYGGVAHASMVLEHGADMFVDAFVLIEDGQRWRIANKVYERVSG